jgi:NAD(P)-dependent dehydrogenase (short-subunit alcohol dehydrogenase family)
VEIKGKTALVTGSAIRVGREICLELARRGANIVVNYRSSSGPAAELVDELRSMGVDGLAVQADVSLSADVARLGEEARRRFGQVDILVNNASIYPRIPLSQTTEADWDESIAINLKGPYLCCMEFGPRMVQAGAGAIINITDWAVYQPYKDYLPYLTAKGGIIFMTKAFAVELAPQVRVNVIAPGPIQPPDYLREDEKAEAATGTLVGRWGGGEEIATAAAFLIEADFITGVTLPVDGGRLIA